MDENWEPERRKEIEDEPGERAGNTHSEEEGPETRPRKETEPPTRQDEPEVSANPSQDNETTVPPEMEPEAGKTSNKETPGKYSRARRPTEEVTESEIERDTDEGPVKELEGASQTRREEENEWEGKD